MTRLMNGHKRRALLLAPLLAVAMAGCAGTPSNDTFDLSVSSATVTQGPSLKGRQLLIDLLNHRCIRVRLPDGSLFRWRFEKDDEPVQIDVRGPIDQFIR